MSTPELLFVVYLSIGMLSIIIAVAAPGKEERSERFGPFGGTELDVALMLFIVLLWPIWLLSLFPKRKPPEEPNQSPEPTPPKRRGSS